VTNQVLTKIRSKVLLRAGTIEQIEQLGELRLMTIRHASTDAIRTGDHVAVITPGGKRRYTAMDCTDSTFSMLGETGHDGPGARWLRGCQDGDSMTFRGPERGWDAQQLRTNDLLVCDLSGIATMLALRADAAHHVLVTAETGGPTTETLMFRYPGLVPIDMADLPGAIESADVIWAAGGKPVTDIVRRTLRSAGRRGHVRTYWAPGRTGME
jgi:NADPH-dependent ferric siderophore reductase